LHLCGARLIGPPRRPQVAEVAHSGSIERVTRTHLLPLVVTAVAVAVAGTPLCVHAQDEMSSDTMSGGAMRTHVVHDPQLFREEVLPLLERECIGCHDAGDPDNRSKHRLFPPEVDGTWDD